MLGHHRQVIFKEDMFGVIENAHKNNDRHRGYKGTFNKVRSPYLFDQIDAYGIHAAYS